MRKWNTLLKEISELSEQNIKLKEQLQRQKENFQGLLIAADKRYYDFTSALRQGFSDPNKKQACEVLVKQFSEIQEERNAVIQENECIHIELNELQAQINTMQSILQTKEAAQDAEALRARNEELEDTILEFKQNSGVEKIAEQELLIESLEIQLAQKSVPPMPKESKEEYLAKLVRDKEKEIEALRKQLEAASSIK